MALFGKVLDLLDDRYLELQDVIGNVEPLPTLVPYEEYAQNVLVYRMDTNHEIFLGLIQDFTMRRAHESGKELWTWLVQWEIDNSTPTQQPSTSKKVCLDAQQANAISKAPLTPRQKPALTIFERRTLDGALMLEEDMLRILIDIVQVASSLAPNFIEFLYRWVDYYEGDGKALKAALRWEIPSLWDFEYHPLVLPREEASGTDKKGEDDTDERRERGQRSVSDSKAAELRQSSPTKKMHARPKPDLAAIELRTFYAEESERLQYREVKFGIQPPKLEQPLPPLINIPRDQRKRTKYYAACFKSRQRALCLLLEAGVTVRQINNYQKLQTAHPKETLETGDGNGLRNYQKDAKYAQAHFELKEKQAKQREIAISNKLAVEAQLATSHAIPDGAAGLPLIPPTPSYVRKTDMAATMMRRIKETRAERDEIINIVPKPLVGRMKSKLFENAKQKLELMSPRGFMAETGSLSSHPLTLDQRPSINDDDDKDIETKSISSGIVNSETGEEDAVAVSVPAPSLTRPSLPMSLPPQPPTETINSASSLNNFNRLTGQLAPNSHPVSALDQSTPPNIATYMQNFNTEQVQCLIPLLSLQARQAAASRLQDRSRSQVAMPQQSPSLEVRPAQPFSSSQPEYTIDPSMLSRLPEASQAARSPRPRPISRQGLETANYNGTNLTAVPGPSSPSPFISNAQSGPQQPITTIADLRLRMPTQRQRMLSADFAAQLDTQPAERSPLVQPADPIRGEWRSEGPRQVQSSIPSSPSFPLLTPSNLPPQLQARLPSLHPVHTIHAAYQLPSNPSTILSSYMPPSGAVLPPPRPGIIRNAPLPLSLSPPSPSPFTTFAPQVLATSPFLNLSSNTRTPIQIYLPKILAPGNGIGPGGTKMGNNGCIETDALMLGYEDCKTGDLVLSKAVLLPVGVWENTLRKVRSGRWSVLETYACPSSHAGNGDPGNGKGKVRLYDEAARGCHRAVYDKLVQAYGMISGALAVREDELTKRWRVSRGPMTSCDRGAVWEGWGVYVDRGIEMSAAEREDALRSEGEASARIDHSGVGDGYGPYSDAYEAERRRKEMEELMDEEDEMDD